MQPGGSVWALNGVLDIIFLSARNVRMNSAGLRVYNMPWQHVNGIHNHRKGSVPSQAQENSSPLIPELHKKYSLSKTGWSRLQTFRNNPKRSEHALHITLIPGTSSSTQLLEGILPGWSPVAPEKQASDRCQRHVVFVSQWNLKYLAEV